MPIAEPMTLFTDYLLAAVVGLLALRLVRDPRLRSRRSIRYWAAGFLAAALAAVTGGTVHGFAPVLGEPARAVLWKATIYLVGLGGWSLLTATAFATLRGLLRRGLIVLATAKLAVYSVWMAGHDAFRYVVYDYAPALLVVLVLHLAAFIRRGDQAAPWIVGGILISFAGAGIQMAGLSLHRHFNHNDLYHVVQMGAFWLWYRGGLRMRDR